FAGDLEQHPPGHVLDDLVAEIGAGGGLGDSHEGCYGTDLPGDQLTGTLPVEVHAGRSEVLQEHVDLAVEPRTSRHVASLPSSRHGARLPRTAGGGNPVVLSPLSPLAVLLLLKPRSARPRPSWTACQKHPASRPGPPSPSGSSPTSRAAGPASASPSCATADGTATSLPSCPATANPRRSCACATRDQPTAGPSGSTWPAPATTPSPNCQPPS